MVEQPEVSTGQIDRHHGVVPGLDDAAGLPNPLLDGTSGGFQALDLLVGFPLWVGSSSPAAGTYRPVCFGA